MGASLPHLLVRAFLHAAMLLAHDGGRAHEVLWQRNDHEVTITIVIITIHRPHHHSHLGGQDHKVFWQLTMRCHHQ